MNYPHEEISIEKPCDGRYHIIGFRAGTVYIQDVGHLAPPQIVDLPMSPDLADALRFVLNDFQPPAPILPAPQLTFQERVILERDELEEKATKLSDFIGNSPIFITLDPAEQERMKVQNDVMWQYVEVLDARIDAFPAAADATKAPAKTPRKRATKKEGGAE